MRIKQGCLNNIVVMNATNDEDSAFLIAPDSFGGYFQGLQQQNIKIKLEPDKKINLMDEKGEHILQPENFILPAQQVNHLFPDPQEMPAAKNRVIAPAEFKEVTRKITTNFGAISIQDNLNNTDLKLESVAGLGSEISRPVPEIQFDFDGYARALDPANKSWERGLDSLNTERPIDENLSIALPDAAKVPLPHITQKDQVSVIEQIIKTEKPIYEELSMAPLTMDQVYFPPVVQKTPVVELTIAESSKVPINMEQPISLIDEVSDDSLLQRLSQPESVAGEAEIQEIMPYAPQELGFRDEAQPDLRKQEPNNYSVHAAKTEDVTEAYSPKENLNKLTLHINQKELGDIRAQIEVKDKQSHITFLTDTLETKQLIQNHVTHLKDVFNDAQLPLVKATIQYQSNQQQEHKEQPRSRQELIDIEEATGNAFKRDKEKQTSSIVDTYA